MTQKSNVWGLDVVTSKGECEIIYRDILEMYNTKVMAEQYGKKYEMAINKRGGYSMT